MLDTAVWWKTSCPFCKPDEALECKDPVCRGRGYGEVHTDECPANDGALINCDCLKEVA